MTETQPTRRVTDYIALSREASVVEYLKKGRELYGPPLLSISAFLQVMVKYESLPSNTNE